MQRRTIRFIVSVILTSNSVVGAPAPAAFTYTARGLSYQVAESDVEKEAGENAIPQHKYLALKIVPQKQRSSVIPNNQKMK